MVRQLVGFALLVMMLASTLAMAQKARQPQMAKDYVQVIASSRGKELLQVTMMMKVLKVEFKLWTKSLKICRSK